MSLRLRDDQLTQLLDCNRMLQELPLADGEIRFIPRGLGNNWIPCFVCGTAALGDGLGEGSCNDDMAAFVRSKADGEAVVRLFEEAGCKNVKLDYRDYEPDWIQVKVGACPEHYPSLALLAHNCGYDNRISLKTIQFCLPKFIVRPPDPR